MLVGIPGLTDPVASRPSSALTLGVGGVAVAARIPPYDGRYAEWLKLIWEWFPERGVTGVSCWATGV